MSKTPSSALNLKIRGKKVELLPEDEELISLALSIIWTKSNKKIESCNFDQDKVRLSFKKNEGRVYFDLQESALDFTFINKGNLAKLERYKSLYELYKGRYEPENTRSTSTSRTTGSVNESLKELLQYSTPEHTCLESSPSSSLYLKPNYSELARVLNSDLSINNLSTSDTETKIWSNLNLRCIEKFGRQDHIKNDVSISDIMWASTTLPAYRSWNTMKNYYDDIDNWIAKISSFCTAKDDEDNNFQPAEAANSSSTRGKSGNSEINESNPPSQYKVVPASRLRARASTTEVETSIKPPTRSITSKVKLATQVPTREVIVFIESRVPTSEMNSSAEVPPEMTLAKSAESSVAESRALSEMAVEESVESAESQALASEMEELEELEASTSMLLSKSIVRKCNFSDDDDDDDDDKAKLLNSTQLLLFKKGKKLHDILLADLSFNGELIASEELKVLDISDISNNLNEMLKDDPVKIVDEKSAKDRIDQWRRQELQCENFVIAAKSFNLLHLVSLVQIYDDLFKLGEKLRTDPKNNIKTAKSWVIQFIRSVLKIGDKMEQRNRVGCDRLRRIL
ncbi:hypothetical protein GLOIN_2v1881506 [Rhizophagus irregularis DAOM 181602=DAOM 197198]|uniref:Uncharacterized protein n=1 Tax=Rhizophagus irregularis (strain DAOM 181602 / DAOM 197198 / MUCL 43194) TaxID=747089 RepID=A0A2P4PFX0_RHIID|nr:hypothetical protein GLOIN_2v1881506 [Rhizophagus irregularis DAOM 181602=DAOM 197198]POG64275.1 hypothetical protein GLOIN_2v1881506 [Rhizophagus irregularis DAOM 181602=DAOM 197198]|eukprot:XP_025171141.1 hypothetical protein GLOIN_2v1881506 [Rhizophagus irregularis DAOM 181602=DAOM 197198]